jgi:hypothetical protein
MTTTPEARRSAVSERGRRLYHTRYRQMLAVKRHLIGQGVSGVADEGTGWGRRLTLPGWNVRVVQNLHRLFEKRGRHEVIAEYRFHDPRNLVIFDVSMFTEDPEEILVTVPMDVFVDLLRKCQQAGHYLRTKE